jgi:RecA-family ATPase
MSEMFGEEIPDVDPFDVDPFEEQPASEPPEAEPAPPAEPSELPERLAKFRALRTQRLDGVTPRNPEWLWDQRIPLNLVSIIEGHPGVGKSSVLMDLVARASRGGAWPGEAPYETHPVRKVLWLTNEDSVEMTVVPRLMAAGACLENIFVSTEIPLLGVKGGHQETAAAALAVERTLVETGADILVLDPGSSTVDDGNAEPIIRQVMGLFYRLGEEYGVTTLWIRHLAKASGDRSPLMAGIGSIGVAAAARSVLQLHEDVQLREQGEVFYRHLCHVKSNLSERQKTITFTIQREYQDPGKKYELEPSTQVNWGETVEITAEGIMQRNARGGQTQADKTRVADTLEAFLQKRGRCSVGDFIKAAQAATGKTGRKFRDYEPYWRQLVTRAPQLRKEGQGAAAEIIYSDDL